MILKKEYSAPPINHDEILRYMGCKTTTPETEQLIDQAIALAALKLEYKICCCEFSISGQNNILDLGFAKAESNDLARYLEGCHKILLFASTVGLELDRLILRYSRTSPAMAVCLQALGAERIEALCDAFCCEMKAQYNEEGKIIRPRFSPGYGDLSLSLQKEIFRVLDCPRQIGLTLNDSLLMSPTKSVTAIIGIKDKT